MVRDTRQPNYSESLDKVVQHALGGDVSGLEAKTDGEVLSVEYHAVSEDDKEEVEDEMREVVLPGVVGVLMELETEVDRVNIVAYPPRHSDEDGWLEGHFQTKWVQELAGGRLAMVDLINRFAKTVEPVSDESETDN